MRRGAESPVKRPTLPRGPAVGGPEYGERLMNAWDELERRVRERGVRVERRLALIALLRDDHGASERLAARRRLLLAAVEKAAADVRREAHA